MFYLAAASERPDSVSFYFNLKAKKQDDDHKAYLKTATIREVYLYFLYALYKRVELALSLRRILALALSYFRNMPSIHRHHRGTILWYLIIQRKSLYIQNEVMYIYVCSPNSLYLSSLQGT